MTSLQRLTATLNHTSPDRVCVDLGAAPTTGIAASMVSRLREAVLGEKGYRVKVIEPYQMLGEVDETLRKALGIDVVGLPAPKTMFGFANEHWKPMDLFDGTPALVPGDFNITVADNGDWLMHPQGDRSSPPSARMPQGGFYFDAICRQEPIDDDTLDPADNLEEFGLLSDSDLRYYRTEADRLARSGDCGVLAVLPGTAFGDVALVPAVAMKHTRGIRDVEEWYVSTVTRKDYVKAVFAGQCEIALANIERLAAAVGDKIQVAYVSGTDLGTQRGPFLSAEAYRDLYKPYQKKINDFIHERTTWKTFMHSCGSVRELIEDFIDAGFDILNPVQCSAAGMDPVELKRQYGSRLVFWGGGVDTQQTLPFGTPREVYDQVRRRIDIFNDGGGFVFNAIHNIQANTPLENLLAMFKAIRDS